MQEHRLKLNNIMDTKQYYNGDECLKAMEVAFGKEAVIAFCKLNAFKYVWRSGKKTDDFRQDFEKAQWYLNYANNLKDAEPYC